MDENQRFSPDLNAILILSPLQSNQGTAIPAQENTVHTAVAPAMTQPVGQSFPCRETFAGQSLFHDGVFYWDSSAAIRNDTAFALAEAFRRLMHCEQEELALQNDYCSFSSALAKVTQSSIQISISSIILFSPDTHTWRRSRSISRPSLLTSMRQSRVKTSKPSLGWQAGLC